MVYEPQYKCLECGVSFQGTHPDRGWVKEEPNRHVAMMRGRQGCPHRGESPRLEGNPSNLHATKSWARSGLTTSTMDMSY